MAVCANPASDSQLIFLIIAELIDLSVYKSHVRNELEDDVHKNAFTRTSCEHASTSARASTKSTGSTFSVDPDQRSRLFPVPEGTTFDEPHASTFMMSIIGSVVIDEWIRGREPT